MVGASARCSYDAAYSSRMPSESVTVSSPFQAVLQQVNQQALHSTEEMNGTSLG